MEDLKVIALAAAATLVCLAVICAAFIEVVR